MKKFNLSPHIFLSASLLTLGFQCHNESPAPVPAYEYAEKLTLAPYRKAYAINDTIWVEFQTEDKTLFDKLSGIRITTDTTYLGLNFYFQRHYPIGNTVELFSDATAYNALEVGFTPLYTYYNVLNFRTDCVESRYFFRVAFVPKKAGIFSIVPQAAVSPCLNKLSITSSTFTFTFDLADCNKDVWLSIPPQSRGGEHGFTDLSIDRKEMFVFKVE